MKNLELELQVAPMSNDTMEYLNVLFGVYSSFNELNVEYTPVEHLVYTPVHVRLLKYFRLLEGSALDICRPFLYTILVVVAFSQPQLTTKNEIGNPFRGSLSHFFVGAILQQPHFFQFR